MTVTATAISCCDIGHVKEHCYFVYVVASRSHNFYVGVTNDIERRVRQHKEPMFEGFTSKYNVNRLVWYQTFRFIQDAIAREKQIKNWRRKKKIALIESMNSTWQDLSGNGGGRSSHCGRTPGPLTPATNHGSPALGMTRPGAIGLTISD
jgi:putative endonuclease